MAESRRWWWCSGEDVEAGLEGLIILAVNDVSVLHFTSFHWKRKDKNDNAIIFA